MIACSGLPPCTDETFTDICHRLDGQSLQKGGTDLGHVGLDVSASRMEMGRLFEGDEIRFIGCAKLRSGDYAGVNATTCLSVCNVVG